VDGKLMAQCNNFELQREPPAERGDEEVHQCNAECSHGSVVWVRSGARSLAVLRCASAIGRSPRSGGKVSPNQCVRIFGTHKWLNVLLRPSAGPGGGLDAVVDSERRDQDP
jgi:hypothetical protein